MKKILLIFILLFNCAEIFAQQTISGYVNLETFGDTKQEVVLSRTDSWNENVREEIISTAAIWEDGYFAFEDAAFSEKDGTYRIRVQNATSEGYKILDTTINNFRSFIFSNRDTLFFQKGSELLSDHSTSNKADKEWQKLKEYEEKIAAANDLSPDEYLAQKRNYTKDSLQILLVKLISIKTLDEKNLLERDIKENADFYLDLLEKLQESDLDPASYTYLESKIRSAHMDRIQRKYQVSVVLNLLGFSGVAGLLFVVFRMRRKKENLPRVPLSKQEENVKNLLLEGKTNKEIAAALFISISTVKTHTSNIYSKLNVSNRRELLQNNRFHTGTST